jgi:hypothetical protein
MKRDTAPLFKSMRGIRWLAGVVGLASMASPLAAQNLGAADYATISDFALNRCLAPMAAGEIADLSGVRPVADASSTVFTDNAGTLDDRVALDFSTHRGLRSCDVGTNSITARFAPEVGFEQMVTALDGIVEGLISQGYNELDACWLSQFAVSGTRVLEQGDYLRRVVGSTSTRPGIYLTVDASAAMGGGGDAGIVVHEHYGLPEDQC